METSLFTPYYSLLTTKNKNNEKDIFNVDARSRNFSYNFLL